MQGDSAAHRRSLSVSRTSKFAQALVSCFLPFYARCCTADFAVGGDSLTLGGVLVELARSASTRGGSFAVAPGISKSEVESDFDNQCPICFQTGVTIGSGRSFFSGAGFGALCVALLRWLLRVGRLVGRVEAGVGALWAEARAVPERAERPFVRRPDGLPR
jgi:hypothetical protein